jgi:hypothetical protein
VRISSHAGNFFAVASSRSMIELGHKLLERTRKQLGRWKHRRYARRGHRFIPRVPREDLETES